MRVFNLHLASLQRAAVPLKEVAHKLHVIVLKQSQDSGHNEDDDEGDDERLRDARGRGPLSVSQFQDLNEAFSPYYEVVTGEGVNLSQPLQSLDPQNASRIAGQPTHAAKASRRPANMVSEGLQAAVDAFSEKMDKIAREAQVAREVEAQVARATRAEEEARWGRVIGLLERIAERRESDE